MGREIEILNFYKALGFKELPKDFVDSLLKKRSRKKVDFVDKTSKDLSSINEEIKICIKCSLSKTRIQAVVGTGSLEAELMFIGEAPGVDEDKAGEPFVGEAGKLLNRLIEKMGFKREEVYITNTVKCHPPHNRTPFEEEVSLCFDYLKKEIEIVMPKVIMTLGKVATYALMSVKEKEKLKDVAITKLRGKVFFTIIYLLSQLFILHIYSEIEKINGLHGKMPRKHQGD